MLKRNQIVLFIVLALTVAFILYIVFDDLKAWCLYLIVLIIVGSMVFRKVLFTDKGNGVIEPAKTPWSLTTQQYLQSAKEKIKAARPKEAIEDLFLLKNTFDEEQLTLISARLTQFRKDDIAGVLTHEQNTTQLNRINKDLLYLIKDVENQLTAGQKENQQLRDAFRQRYRDRLVQKLASRQPVNLRRFATQEGTSKIVADTFVPYSSEAIKVEIGKTFQDAYGRLLIVGQPGAGKTTLLLQLADRLFDLEVDALPVVLNLATWKSSFGTLDAWRIAVMASELSTNQAGVKAALSQDNLIVLLDGLDELKEDAAMNSCLAAIAEYGSVAGRKFVITSRIEEYKRVQEDARVNLQIEVGPLEGDQLEAELNRMGREQPEALPLLQAIQKYPLLRQAVEIPFYFNALQLLFAGKLPMFTTTDLDSRKQEIKQLFIQSALQRTVHKSYAAADSTHWLSFLAANMNERNLVVFELRDLQYDWWRSWSRLSRVIGNSIYSLSNSLLFCILTGLMSGLLIGLVKGLVNGIITGLILSIPVIFVNVLYNGLSIGPVQKINTKDDVNWSIMAFKKAFISVIGLYILCFICIFSIFFRFIIVLVIALAIVLTFVLFKIIATESSDFIQIKSPYQRFNASMKVLHFSIVQHWHLRYLLYKKGALPLDLVDFLNEMKDRNLLESDGATWRFRHRMIQDYFAALWEKETTRQ